VLARGYNTVVSSVSTKDVGKNREVSDDSNRSNLINFIQISVHSSDRKMQVNDKKFMDSMLDKHWQEKKRKWYSQNINQKNKS